MEESIRCVGPRLPGADQRDVDSVDCCHSGGDLLEGDFSASCDAVQAGEGEQHAHGSNALRWPLLAGLSRLIIAVGGGYLLLRWTGNLAFVYAALAAGLAALGLMIALAVKGGAWFKAVRG